ncbi:MAG: PIN domain nuclease, partial [Cyclobacteriaceae bacterium]
MRLLLDTHILIWSLASPQKVQDTIKYLMEDSENSLFVSSITFYEITFKRQIGKLSLKFDFDELLDQK